jgi:hypothetical protein
MPRIGPLIARTSSRCITTGSQGPFYSIGALVPGPALHTVPATRPRMLRGCVISQGPDPLSAALVGDLYAEPGDQANPLVIAVQDNRWINQRSL